MKSNRAITVFDRNAWWLLALAYVGLLWTVAPLRAAFQFGGDEGYELMKALLVSRGYALYDPIWNDQPPLYTLLLGKVFGWSGPSVYAARLLAVGFAGILVTSMYCVVRRRSGPLAATVAVLLLIATSSFAELSVSVITELPAMGVGLLSVAVFFRHYGRTEWQQANGGGVGVAGRGGGGVAFDLNQAGVEIDGQMDWKAPLSFAWWQRKRWLVLSGIVLGCALQIKFTAAILVPALVVELLSNASRSGIKQSRQWFGLATGEMLVWGTATVATFGVLTLAFYSKSVWGIFWQSHFSEALSKALAKTGSTYVFSMNSVLTNYGTCLAALLGVVLVLRGRRWELSFPIVLLLTALVVHVNHEPYWYYYWLHFAIALAWLAGVGVEAGWVEMWVANPLRRRVAGLAWTLPGVWLLMVSIVAVGWLEGMGKALSGVENAPAVKQIKLATALATNQVQARWVFADRGIFAFHAGLPVPPELAVLSKKRFWTGQINAKAIVSELQKYRPELILLAGWLRQDWTSGEGRDEHHISMPRGVIGDYINGHYEEVFRDHTGSLYVRKDLAPQKPRETKQVITLGTNELRQAMSPH